MKNADDSWGITGAIATKPQDGSALGNDHHPNLVDDFVKRPVGFDTRTFDMSNFIVSYDLNGPNPSHKQVDDLLEQAGAARGRILESVWYVGWVGTTPKTLLEYLRPLFSENDLLIVVEAEGASWTKLLVDDQSLLAAWEANR